MKLDRGHWVIIALTVALVGYITLYTPVSGYLSQRQARAAQAAAEAQQSTLSEGVANVTTAGSISTGTVLKREGVAVAELWGMKKIGGRTAEVVKFTSHDSADRFREFLQGLRERETFQLLGHELPTQTALWVDDFNDPQHRLYTVETPDGEEYEFCGWVRRVKTHPPLEGALVFEADIQCTHGPLTREVTTGGYYHCTEAPPAPGTPPPDDPDNWEKVEAPEGIADGESLFGHAGDGNDNFFDTWHGYGGGFVYPYGTTTGTFVSTDAQVWPDWSDPIPLTNKPAYVPVMHCVVSQGKATEIVALISNAGGDTLTNMHAALFDGDNNLLAASEVYDIGGVTGSVERHFPLTSSPELVDGEEYRLMVASETVVTEASPFLLADNIDDYTPPDGGEWDPDEEYVYCQTVYYSTTVEESYCP